jgi:cytochrome oxidase assembly protein ShyY1
VTRTEPVVTGGQAARGALRLLREGTWVLSLAGVVVLSVVFVLLGRWQLHRHEGKVERRDRVAAHYDAVPVPLDQVLPAPGAPLPASEEWRRVTVTGRYEAAGTVLVRNRPLDGENGYDVVVPLRTAGGAALLVDRGWVPSGSTGAAPDAVPPAPEGTVTVTAWLRPSEPGVARAAPPGQSMRIDVPRLARSLAGPVYGAYGVLAGESPPPSDAPRRLPRPDVGLGPHLAYAVQWWAFALAAYVLLGYYAVREVYRRAGAPPPRLRRPRGHEPAEEQW